MLGAFVRKRLGRRSAEIGHGVSHFFVDRGHIMLRRPGGAFAFLAAATTSTATATPTTAACIAVAFATSVARLGFPASFDGLAVSLSLLIGFGETLAFRKLALLLALSLTLLAALALGLPLPAFPGSITALARLAAPATAATPPATTTIVTSLAACLRRLFFRFTFTFAGLRAFGLESLGLFFLVDSLFEFFGFFRLLGFGLMFGDRNADRPR